MIRGIVYTLISALSIAIMGVFIKEIGVALPNATVLFFRFLFSLLVLVPLIFKSNDFSFKVKSPGSLFIRSLMGLLAMASYFYAIKYIPLVNVILLQNTRPIFVPILVFLLFRKRTSKSVILGIIVSFVGIAIIINPSAGVFQPVSFWALAAGLFSAVAIIMLKVFMRENNYKTLEALFYYFLFSTVVTGFMMIFYWVTPTLYQFLLLIGVGVFGTLYQFYMTTSLKYIPVKLAAPLMFFAVIFGGLAGWLFWGETSSWLSIIGIIITILGAVLVIYFNAKEGSTVTKTNKA
jgi:drug/metabolite transporter (DMT)-like permease